MRPKTCECFVRNVHCCVTWFVVMTEHDDSCCIFLLTGIRPLSVLIPLVCNDLFNIIWSVKISIWVPNLAQSLNVVFLMASFLCTSTFIFFWYYLILMDILDLGHHGICDLWFPCIFCDFLQVLRRSSKFP